MFSGPGKGTVNNRINGSGPIKKRLKKGIYGFFIRNINVSQMKIIFCITL